MNLIQTARPEAPRRRGGRGWISGTAWRVLALAALLVLAGCPRKKDTRRGYQDDREIGTGKDIVDGAIGVPLRAARQAEITMTLFSINQMIQVEELERNRFPKDLDEVKAWWVETQRKPFPPPAFRHKYTYDPRTGKVDEVHKSPEEYTEAERGEADPPR